MTAPFTFASGTPAAGSTLTLNVTTATAAGDALAVAVLVSGTTVSSVSDSAGNTYTQQSNPSGSNTWVYTATGSTLALSTSSTVTVHLVGSGTGHVICTDMPGTATIDVNTNASGTSTAPSVTGTPNHAGETALAVFSWGSAGGSGTISSPFTQLTQLNPGGVPIVTTAYDLSPPSGSGLTAAATITSAGWTVILITFEATAITPAPFTPPRSAVRGRQEARKGAAAGSAGAPVVPPAPVTPATFTAPRSAVRGQRAAKRKGTSAGVAAAALTCGSTIASPGLLAGNLLSGADSDFETWTGDWTAGANTAIAQSNKIAFCGCDSLVMTAAGTGAVSATSPFLPFTAPAGLDASGYLYTAYGATGYITVSFWNSGFTLISSAPAAPVGMLAGAWTPVVTAQAAPAGTAWITLTYTVTGMAAGQTAFLDLAYAADTPAQVLIAWPTQPTSSTPLFADVTPWVRADKGIKIGRGRVDEVSEVQATKLTMTLDNTTGWFTVNNPGSPWYPGVLLGRRTQVSEADQHGAWHTRFDGTLTDLPVTWTGGNAAEALTPAAASGVLAKLGRAPGLRTMLEQEMLFDGPMCLYTLADASGSVTASDSSGNGAAPLNQRSYGGGTLAFGSGSPIVEAATSSSPITSVACTPAVTGAGAAGNLDAQLEGFLPAPVTAAAGVTFEIWFTGVTVADNTHGATWYAIALGNPGSGAMLAVSVQGGSASAFPVLTLVYTPDIYSASPVFTTAAGAFPFSMPGMLAVTVSGTTATLWYNDAVVAAITIPATFEATYLTVGGPLGGTQGWQGSLNCAAVWPAVLSSARLQAHWQAGINACAGSYIYQLIANVTRYAGLPSWQLDLPSAGVSVAGLYSLYGQTPLAALQAYEQVDGGLLYENAAGQLAYQDRSARYGAQATGAPALQLAAGQYEPGLLPSITDQFLINDCTTGTTVLAANGTTTITAWTRAVNQASVGNYGAYPDGTPQSPKTGPYYTTSATGKSLDVCQDDADWTAGTRSTPGPRSPVVTVDLLTQPHLRAAVLSAEMGTMLQLNGLPAQYPGGVRPDILLIEGVTDTLKWDGNSAEWTAVFNTSPSMQSAAWLPGDPALGILDLTAVVGRGADTGGAGYTGPPYAVPAFSGTMNLTGNAGARDMRGLTYNLQQALTPPMACISQQSFSQMVTAGFPNPILWDTISFDTSLGFSLLTAGGSSNDFYTIPVTGTWLLMAAVSWSGASGLVTVGIATFGVVYAEQTITGPASGTAGQQVSTKASLTAGTDVWVQVTYTSGTLTLNHATGGCMFSLLFLGET